MDKQPLNEGLFDSLMSAIMMYAVKKDVKENPEFWKKVQQHQAELEKIAKDAEEAANRAIAKSGGIR
jgi:hypothetical protein